MAQFKVTFDMPLKLSVGERAMAIAGRLQDRLQATRVRGVTGPEVATYRIRRGRLRGITVVMTVQGADAAKALVIAMDVLREALGTDARSWDVAGTGAAVVPALTVVPALGPLRLSLIASMRSTSEMPPASGCLAMSSLGPFCRDLLLASVEPDSSRHSYTPAM